MFLFWHPVLPKILVLLQHGDWISHPPIMVNICVNELYSYFAVIGESKSLCVAVAPDVFIVPDYPYLLRIPFSSITDQAVASIKMMIMKCESFNSPVSFVFFHFFQNGKMILFMNNFICLYVKEPVG